jgi:uncharacterized protein
MNRADFRFYAELNDFLAPERRFTSSPFSFYTSTSVKDAIESFGVPHTEVDLVLVNGDPVDFGCGLRDGDRVSVYPVFEAFDISGLLRVRPKPLRVTRFVLDIHLGRLATYLRMAGFDTLYRKDSGDEELARISAGEGRILLTRDVGLLKRSVVTRGYRVRSTEPRVQLAEVLERFDLFGSLAPFERCLRCNAALIPAAKEAVANRLPPHTLEYYSEFRQCPECGRVYWKGSHFRRMEKFIASLAQRRAEA